MSKRIRELRAAKADATKAARAITDRAAADKRDLTAEEQTSFDAEIAKIESLDKSIEREEALARAEAALGSSAVVATTDFVSVEDRRAEDPRRGFASFGEFARAVQSAGIGRSPDERLVIGAAAPSTYSNEGAGADGGFLVPPQFAEEVQTFALGDDALLPLTDTTPVTGNSMVFPKDETTPWGTDGVRAYWQAEAAAATQTKVKIGTAALRLHKLLALVPVTDELLADTNALNGYLPGLMGRSIRWKTNEAILFGNGAGQPQGLMNSAALVVINKESGQAASTLNVTNIAKMVAALMPGSFARAQWLITPDALPALFTMTLGNYPIYIPSSAGAQGSPYGTLMGRPINVSQHSAAFSSQGDIALIDFSWYRAITKAGGGIDLASSMHLYFDADATAFRATFRVDGQSKIAAAVSQAKGSQSLSPFVTLQAR